MARRGRWGGVVGGWSCGGSEVVEVGGGLVGDLVFGVGVDVGEVFVEEFAAVGVGGVAVGEVGLEHEGAGAAHVVEADGGVVAHEGGFDVGAPVGGGGLFAGGVVAGAGDVAVAVPFEVGAFEDVGHPAGFVLGGDEHEVGVAVEGAGEGELEEHSGHELAFHDRVEWVAAFGGVVGLGFVA